MKKAIYSLLILSLFLVACQTSPEQADAEKAALDWVNLEAEAAAAGYPPNMTFPMAGVFYVLDSSKESDGFCVEIASHERQPPKYGSNTYPTITTFPIFVKDSDVQEKDTRCFSKAYDADRARMARMMETKFDASGSEYTSIKFFVVRETTNAIFKLSLKRKGYTPNYDYNPASEFFIESFMMQTYGDSFNETMRIYAKSAIDAIGLDEFLRRAARS